MRILLGILLIAAACAASAAVVTPIPGAADQSAAAAQPFPNAIGVRVTDDAGHPLPGVEVRFVSSTIHGGGLELLGNYYQFVTQSGVDGIATLGTGARAEGGDRHLISASAGESGRLGFATMYFTTRPAVTGNQVSALSPTEQTVEAGRPLPQPPKVRVTRADGSPARRTLVHFFPDPHEIVGSFGAASSATVETDDDGVAVAPPFTTVLKAGRGVVVARHLESVGVFTEARFFYTNVATAATPANYQDLWWGGPDQNGWGVSVVQHGQNVFAVAFAYDANGAPTWYVVPQTFWRDGYGRILDGSAFQTRGSPFFDYDVSRLEVVYGTGPFSLAFTGRKEAQLYLGGKQFATGLAPDPPGKPLVRQQFATDPAAPLKGVGDMWWGGPAQSGWGIAVLEQPGALFSVWLTYDADGKPTWFAMPGGRWTADNVYAGQIYRTHSSSWLYSPYDATLLRVIPAGAYELRFDGANATFNYVVDGRRGSLALSRQPF
jgi:hypothetical protein